MSTPSNGPEGAIRIMLPNGRMIALEDWRDEPIPSAAVNAEPTERGTDDESQRRAKHRQQPAEP